MGLSSLSKTKLFQLRKALSGNIGDTSISREALENYLLTSYSPETIECYIDNLARTENTQMQTQSEPTTTSAPTQDLDTTEKLALELVQALKAQKASKSPDLDPEQVKSLVKDTILDIFGVTMPTLVLTETKAPKMTHSAFPSVYKRLSLSLPVLLTGPAGCGKTHLAEQVASEMGLEFGMLSCSEGMAESHLLGYLLPKASGAIEYTASTFVRLYSEGGLMLLDELDAADPNTLLVLNSALANKKLFVPQAGRTFTMHADFRIIATANTFGVGATSTYAGRNRLDAATLDRFRAGIVPMDYDMGLERLLVSDNNQLIEWATRTRNDIKKRGLKHIMSTRTLTAFDKLMKAGETLESVQETYFLDWTAQERGN